LNNNFSPLYSGYFGDRFSLFVRTGLDHDTPIYVSCHRWEDRSTTLHPAFFPLRWGLPSFFCLDWLQSMICPISASHIAGMIGMHHCTQLSVEMEASGTFCPGKPQRAVLLILAS
jgi:hypothetical protein